MLEVRHPVPLGMDHLPVPEHEDRGAGGIRPVPLLEGRQAEAAEHYHDARRADDQQRMHLGPQPPREQVAGHDAPVLLVGEPGTGREAFARYMHSLGPHAAGPFVAVPCASLDDANAAAMLAGAWDQNAALPVMSPVAAHLDGLALSRAWCLTRLAAAWPEGHARRAACEAAAERHFAAALPQVVGGDYAGEHWLASFAALAMGECP